MPRGQYTRAAKRTGLEGTVGETHSPINKLYGLNGEGEYELARAILNDAPKNPALAVLASAHLTTVDRRAIYGAIAVGYARMADGVNSPGSEERRVLGNLSEHYRNLSQHGEKQEYRKPDEKT